MTSSGGIPTGADLNDYTNNGIYQHGGNINNLTNAPSDASYGLIIVMKAVSYVMQLIFDGSGKFYIRGNFGYWTSWQKIEYVTQ